MTVQRGLSRTQITSSPQSSVPILATPLMFQRVYATDLNANGTGREALAKDGPLVSNVNLTNNYSSGAYQGPSAGDVSPLAIINTSNGVGNRFWGVSDADQLAGNVGVRWANITLYTARFFPKPTAGAPVLSDLAYFCGLSKNVATSGAFPGLMSLTAGQSTPTWMTNIATAGFYFRPNESQFWILLASDGAGNFTKKITNLVPSQTVTHELTFLFDGSTVSFYVNNGKAGTINSTLPPANTGMCNNAVGANLSGTATAQVEALGLGYMCFGFR